MKFPRVAPAIASAFAALFLCVVPAHAQQESFPNTAGVRGLAFQGNELWGVNAAGELVRIDQATGAILETVPILGVMVPFGLGWDSTRNLFVVTEAVFDTVNLVTPTGMLVATFPAPGEGPVGAAYDPVADAYWITDFVSHRLFLVDPMTGVELSSLPAPATAARIAGTGFDSNNNVLMFHSRQTAETYTMDAGTGAVLGSIPTPQGNPGLFENGQGAAIRPADLAGVLSHFEQQEIFVVDLGLTFPECFLVLGPGPGSAEFAPALHTFTTQLSSVERYCPVLMTDPGEIAFPWNGLFGPPQGPVLADFSVQVLLWNPEVFPANPERWSYRLDVVVRQDGSIQQTPAGTPGGIRVGARLRYNAQGRPVIQFPFLVQGL